MGWLDFDRRKNYLRAWIALALSRSLCGAPQPQSAAYSLRRKLNRLSTTAHTSTLVLCFGATVEFPDMEEYLVITKEDLKELTSQNKEHESLLRLRRRWLMDLPLSLTEKTRVEELLFANDILPESFLREDDVSYENIKNCVEMGFGAHKHDKKHGVQEHAQNFNLSDNYKDIFFLLDAMTNKGLCSLSKILTGGLKFEKTKCGMKRTIKEHRRKIMNDKSGTSKVKLEQLSQLMKDPNNFLNCHLVVSIPSETYCDAANKVLDGLEDLCTRTLKAMHRKLKGDKGFVPTLQPKKSGKSRDYLTSSMRKKCTEMLLNLKKGREPAEQLASALGVASLALKHLLNCPVAVNFKNFSPRVEALQNDIAKAIWLLNENKGVSVKELKKVKAFLDPNVKLAPHSLRPGVRNLLTEYLFECGDMDDVPDSLIKTLDIINGKTQLQSHRKKSRLSPQDVAKEEMQEMHKEVECVLNISAQAKEVLLGLLPEHEFDEDFSRAYMEDFEESDTLFTSDDDDECIGNVSIHFEFGSHNSHKETESIGENTPTESNSPVSRSNGNVTSPVHSPNRSLNTPLDSLRNKEMDLDETQSFKESEVQSGRNMERKYNSQRSAVKLERDSPDRHCATSTQNLSSAPPSFAWNSNKNECKTEEFKVEQTNIDTLQSGFSNMYLEIQEACDTTSMAAYRFVGQKLERLAGIEGIELDQGDRSYLLSGASVPEDFEESSETTKLQGMWKDVLEC